MKRILLLSLLFILPITYLFAGTTGKLAGKITDAKTGEGLPFVNITLVGTSIGGASDIDGNYVILNIAPGKYDVKVQYVGYRTQIIKDVSISIDLTTKLNVELSDQSVKLGEVVVEAKSRGVQKDVTSSQASVSNEQIENLPVAELNDVIQLQAGVTKGAGGEFHIRGGRASEIAYQVNGISVTDSYDKTNGIEIDNSAVQELQVISGTFNAEYGDAMSGIINTVTKEGGSQFHGNVKVYSGDYVSNHSDIFLGVNDINPVANYNIQGSLSGPIIKSNIANFFVNARYVSDDGYLNGRRDFTTTGAAGDGEIVSMNWSKRFIGLGNLSIAPAKGLKFNLEGLYSNNNFQDYDHSFKLEPDGNVFKFSRSYTTTFTMTHTPSQYTFYTIRGSYFNHTFNEYLYENPLDSRYLHPDSLNTVGFAFHDKGTNNHRFFRETKTFLVKFDFTSQVASKHLIKFGGVFKSHELSFDNFNLEPKTVNGSPVIPFEPAIPTVASLNRDKYQDKPREGAFYFQDKIEFSKVIINIGLRFDYFDSRGKILVDPQDPNIYAPLRPGLDSLSLAKREPLFYKDATAKYQLSPRFGIAYPITATGVVHFSYGHFLQVPPFSFLYNNGNYKVATTGGPFGPFGNPDINPQRTVMYELGLRQELGEFLVDVTMFYRDIRDWVTSGPFIQTRNGVAYSIYTNKDYANVKGVTLNFNKRFSDHWALDFNYTYQVAEGSNSTPEEEFFAQTGNNAPTLYLLPLDWDQRHLINASLYFGAGNFGASFIARFGTGLPYTPSITQFTADRGITSGFTRNTQRRPNQFNLDEKLDYSFNIGPIRLTLFARVFNLLDTKTVVNVFSDTGKPDFTTEGQNVGNDPNRPNTVAEYLTRPWNYASPRKFQFGFEFNF